MSGVFDFFIDLLDEIWGSIKKIFLPVINFFKNIVDWFKDPQRLSKLKADNNTIAVAIKENLASGNYRVVNCLFDKENKSVVDLDESCALGMESNSIDQDTSMQFGDKSMLILQ